MACGSAGSAVLVVSVFFLYVVAVDVDLDGFDLEKVGDWQCHFDLSALQRIGGLVLVLVSLVGRPLRLRGAISVVAELQCIFVGPG